VDILELPAETVRRLEELGSSDLTSPEAVTAFYIELAGVVRTTLAWQLDIPVRRQTTADLVAVLDRCENVSPSATEHIRSVLEDTDLVKYAGWRPDPEAARKTLRTARTGLTQVRAERPSA
jgi:hypothetical protein